MLSPDLKKKLSEIVAGEIVRKPMSSKVVKRHHGNFKEDFPGRVITTAYGDFYLCEKLLSEFHSNAEKVTQQYFDFFENILPPDIHDDFQTLLSFAHSQALFLDIETTGLSNSPLFLVGAMYCASTDKDETTFKIDQLFARDYSEEISLLHYLNEVFANFKVLVTFNGLSFDIPFIRNRMIYHRLKPEIDHFHFDILHHSRRKWRGQVPNCKLQTLETRICNRRRIGDIPSALIPDAYHEFVRTGDTLLLKEIFQHNALDLITMAELIVALK
jgi:uncharacterized protein YprB with RNaseH-like and TPR domain